MTADPSPAPEETAAHSGSMTNERRWYSDRLGGVLVGGGLVCGALATVLYVQARGSLDDAEAAPTFPEYEDHVDRARTQRLGAVVLAAAAGGLVIAGAIRYSRATETRSLAIAPTPGGGLVAWTGRF